MSIASKRPSYSAIFARFYSSCKENSVEIEKKSRIDSNDSVQIQLLFGLGKRDDL